MMAYHRRQLFSRFLCLAAVALFTVVTANVLVICFGVDGHQAVELSHDSDSHDNCDDMPLQTIAGVQQPGHIFTSPAVVGIYEVADHVCFDALHMALKPASQPPPYHPHLHSIVLLI
jgi:hypothetical protein